VIIVSESRAISSRERVGVVSAPGETISPATDVRRARGRLAAVSPRSERAAAAADRAEHGLVAALRAHCGGIATAVDVIAAREGLSAVRDRAVDAYLRAQDAVRAGTQLTRSLGGLPVLATGFVYVLADDTPVR